jgi:hypothetical protein
MDDILKQLQDFDNYGITASDRYHLRKEAYDEIKRLRAERDAMREALEFYANEENWDDVTTTPYDTYISKATIDNGDKARAALNPSHSEQK